MTDPLAGFQLPRNEHAIRACVNTSTTVTIAAGDVVELDTAHSMSSTQTGIGVIQGSAADHYPYGVAVDGAAPGAQLRVQRFGLIGVVASAANSGVVTIGDIVEMDSAGQVKTTAGGKPQVGQALNTTAAQGDPLMIELDIAKNA